MLLKDYINQLNEFVKENPEALELEAVYARDPEGNGFYSIHYGPTLGHYSNREFSQEIEEDESINACCIN
jgi:hypothetical protein